MESVINHQTTADASDLLNNKENALKHDVSFLGGSNGCYNLYVIALQTL